MALKKLVAGNWKMHGVSADLEDRMRAAGAYVDRARGANRIAR